MAGTDDTPLDPIKATGRESLRRKFENSREIYVTLVTAASNVALSNITPFFQLCFFIAVNGYFISEQFLKLRYTDSQSIKVGCLTILSLLAPVTYTAFFLSAISDPTKKNLNLESLLGFITPIVPVICRILFNRNHTTKDLLKDAENAFSITKKHEIKDTIQAFLDSISTTSDSYHVPIEPYPIEDFTKEYLRKCCLSSLFNLIYGKEHTLPEELLLKLAEIAKVDYMYAQPIFDLINSHAELHFHIMPNVAIEDPPSMEEISNDSENNTSRQNTPGTLFRSTRRREFNLSKNDPTLLPGAARSYSSESQA